MSTGAGSRMEVVLEEYGQRLGESDGLRLVGATGGAALGAH